MLGHLAVHGRLPCPDTDGDGHEEHEPGSATSSACRDATVEGWLPWRDLGVKSSLFYVLLGARMPSILIEAGFLSHKGEGKLLARADYQKSTAKAIANGLLEHLRTP